MLRRAFAMFDSSKSGKIEKEKVRTILNTLGHTYDDGELDELLETEDAEGKFLTAIKQRLVGNTTEHINHDLAFLIS